MSDLTRLLESAREGGNEAMGELFAQVYGELRRVAGARLAALRPGQTLTPTVLVHEAYEKLLRADALEFSDRQHFFACVGRAMRQIALDHARAQGTDKRGGGIQHTGLTEAAGMDAGVADLIEIDMALEQLGQVSPELLKLVELRYFAGLDLDEIARLGQRSRRTVDRDWQRARLLLHGLLTESGPEPRASEPA